MSSVSCCLVGLQLTLSVWVKVMHNVSLLFVCPYYCTHNRIHTMKYQADILSDIRVTFLLRSGNGILIPSTTPSTLKCKLYRVEKPAYTHLASIVCFTFQHKVSNVPTRSLSIRTVLEVHQKDCKLFYWESKSKCWGLWIGWSFLLRHQAKVAVEASIYPRSRLRLEVSKQTKQNRRDVLEQVKKDT